MRTGEGKMSVTTDMDKVQKEIAIMKKLIHPNLVRLYEVRRRRKRRSSSSRGRRRTGEADGACAGWCR